MWEVWSGGARPFGTMNDFLVDIKLERLVQDGGASVVQAAHGEQCGQQDEGVVADPCQLLETPGAVAASPVAHALYRDLQGMCLRATPSERATFSTLLAWATEQQQRLAQEVGGGTGGVHGGGTGGDGQQHVLRLALGSRTVSPADGDVPSNSHPARPRCDTVWTQDAVGLAASRPGNYCDCPPAKGNAIRSRRSLFVGSLASPHVPRARMGRTVRAGMRTTST